MPSRFRRRVIIGAVAVIVVIAAAVVILLAYSNRILKDRLEKAMGPDFRVDSISLSWNSVDVNGPRFMRDGRTAASAQAINIRADFLAILKSGISVSSIVLDQPSIRLEIDPDGQIVLPFALPEKKETAKPGKPEPVEIKEIVIRNGTLFFQDRRMSAPNSIEAQKLNAAVSDFSFPFKNQPQKFSLDTQLAGKLASGSVAVNGNYNLETKAVEVKFDGKGLAYADAGGGAGPAAKLQSLTFSAASDALTEKPLVISNVVVARPYLRVETDSRGNLKAPFGPGKKKPEKEEKEGVPVEIKKIQVSGGEFLYLDGKVSSRPFPVRFTDVNLFADYVAVPVANKWTTFQFSANIPGNSSTGALAAIGKTDLKTKDTGSRITLRNLDLTVVKPYIARRSETDFSRGFLDLDTDLVISKQIMRAPVHVVIRGLQFPSGAGLTARFLGVPRSLITKTMAAGNNQLALDFVLEGNINNPQFNWQETLVRNLSSEFARNFGAAAVKSGDTAIKEGREAVKGAQEQFKGLKEQFKDVFK